MTSKYRPRRGSSSPGWSDLDDAAAKARAETSAGRRSRANLVRRTRLRHAPRIGHHGVKLAEYLRCRIERCSAVARRFQQGSCRRVMRSVSVKRVDENVVSARPGSTGIVVDVATMQGSDAAKVPNRQIRASSCRVRQRGTEKYRWSCVARAGLPKVKISSFRTHFPWPRVCSGADGGSTSGAEVTGPRAPAYRATCSPGVHRGSSANLVMMPMSGERHFHGIMTSFAARRGRRPMLLLAYGTH